MKRFSLIILISFGLYGKSSKAQDQTSKGILFEQKLSWEQIIAKAKEEHKYIFVDCYATWCAPCRQMDQNVYSNDTVGKTINEHFISVKVQMDSTKNDNDDVRSWYATGHKFKSAYKISALPTFLFFDSDGKIVHSAVGYYALTSFIDLTQNVLKRGNQYYNLLNRYQQGKLDYPAMYDLAHEAISLGDKEKAKKIATTYIRQYLAHLASKDFLKKQNIEFIADFIESLRSSDPAFNYFLRDQAKIDSILKFKGYANLIVNYVINQEQINYAGKQLMDKGIAPDWQKLHQRIATKYGQQRADKIITDAKITWYATKTNVSKNNKDPDEHHWGQVYARAVAEKLEKYGLDNSGFGAAYNSGNNIELAIYRYCNDRKILLETLSWLDRIMRDTPGEGFSYVYAGILYKLGNKNAALFWQQMTLSIMQGEACERKEDPIKNRYYVELQDILTGMKANQPFEKLIFEL